MHATPETGGRVDGRSNCDGGGGGANWRHGMPWAGVPGVPHVAGVEVRYGFARPPGVTKATSHMKGNIRKATAPASHTNRRTGEHACRQAGGVAAQHARHTAGNYSCLPRARLAARARPIPCRTANILAPPYSITPFPLPRRSRPAASTRAQEATQEAAAIACLGGLYRWHYSCRVRQHLLEPLFVGVSRQRRATHRQREERQVARQPQGTGRAGRCTSSSATGGRRKCSSTRLRRGSQSWRMGSAKSSVIQCVGMWAAGQQGGSWRWGGGGFSKDTEGPSLARVPGIGCAGPGTATLPYDQLIIGGRSCDFAQKHTKLSKG
eukprot:365232-Chlamydomonas_euryale.AAC.10